jgi:hypothetical protein
MRFRWAAGIALWTFVTGPIFGPPTTSQFPYRHETRAAGLSRPAHSADRQPTASASADKETRRQGDKETKVAG